MDVDDALSVELAHDLYRLTRALDVLLVPVGAHDVAALEPLGDAGLTGTRPGDVDTFGNPSETALFEWVVKVVLPAHTNQLPKKSLASEGRRPIKCELMDSKVNSREHGPRLVVHSLRWQRTVARVNAGDAV